MISSIAYLQFVLKHLLGRGEIVLSPLSFLEFVVLALLGLDIERHGVGYSVEADPLIFVLFKRRRPGIRDFYVER